MSSGLVVLLMVVSGAVMAFQGPINAALRLHVGVVESSLISFLVGTIALIVIVAVAGKGNLLAARHAPPWQLVGGLIGVLFVTSSLLAVPKIGVPGQMVAGLLIDRYGWAGVPARPIDPTRLAGVALLFVSVVLINWNNWKKA
jgi:transporter family-2 protein